MSSESEGKLDRKAVGSLLGLLVHDLRNPTSTLAANVEFLGDVEIGDPDAKEALDDMKVATDELARGLEQVAWVAGWLSGSGPFSEAVTDVAATLEAHFTRGAGRGVLFARVGDGPFAARGGASAGRIVDVLLANAREHARGDVRVEARRDGAFVVVSVVDGGRAIGEAKRELAFTLEGQGAIEGTPDGRYGRYLGLLAAHAAIATLGGSVSAHGLDGEARFDLRFPVA